MTLSPSLKTLINKISWLEHDKWRTIFLGCFLSLTIFSFFTRNVWFYINPSGFWTDKSFWDNQEMEHIIISFQLEAPSFAPREKWVGNKASITLQGINYSYTGKDSVSKICIVSLPFEDYVFSIDNDLGKLSGFDLLDTPVCSDVRFQKGLYQTYIDLSAIHTGIRTVDLGVSFQQEMYPFINDGHRFAYQVVYYLIDPDNKKSEIKTIDPAVYIGINDQLGWDIEFSPQKEILTEDVLSQKSIFTPGIAETLLITFSGPLYYRVFSVFILLGMLILILMLFQIKETGTFIEATAAIFFGLFAIKQALIPSGLSIHTVLDLSILLLYSLVVYMIIDHFVLRRIINNHERITLARKRKKTSIIASISSILYHRKSCRFASSILVNTRIYYDSEEEAKRSGKKPCKKCFSQTEAIQNKSNGIL